VKFVSPLFAVLCLSSTFTFACETDTLIERSQRLAEQGRTFSAIDELTVGLDSCYHPRIKLELGALYLSIGDLESALELWQSALNEDKLPPKVASTVKLRIIQARLKPPSLNRAHLLFGTGARFHSVSGVSNDVLVYGIGKHRAMAFNTWGYPMSPGLYGKFSGSNRYYWQNDSTLSSLLLEAGFLSESKPATLTIGANMQNVNNALYAGATAKLSLKASSLGATTEVDWSTQNHQLTATETISFTPEFWSASLSIESLRIAEQWQLGVLESKVRINNQWKPTLQLQYDFSNTQLSGYAQFNWSFSSHVWLQAQTGTTLTSAPTWYSKLVLNWQPF